MNLTELAKFVKIWQVRFPNLAEFGKLCDLLFPDFICLPLLFRISCHRQTGAIRKVAKRKLGNSDFKSELAAFFD